MKAWTEVETYSPEAVIALAQRNQELREELVLIRSMAERNAALLTENAALRAENAALRARIPEADGTDGR